MRLGLCPQGGGPLPFERDGRTFGVVLVVCVRVQRCGDNSIELVDQSVKALERPGALGLQELACQ
jgi:hypothetical protein